ncbi:hypothetical protein [Sulfurimonas paralvinellae]|uniref:DUF302 domain-containing protein n=1 Tax=Sulfurimonas paralvinellae TaxID=317658 RepID=A0A7M1B9S7_9BACT|nr:hypothetical protein [Sulfurimonas paralvinellae]QOP46477.1 hypothetical protein FM071_09295 [Sulfurimonas paralvinellae]
MKTFTLFLLMLLVVDVSASDSHWEALIIKKMLEGMSTKSEIRVYSHDTHLEHIAADSEKIFVVKNCEKADFVLSDKGIQKSCKKPIIVFSYEKYLKDPKAVGVFFWQKGRPTIRFSSKRLQQFGLQVKGELLKFVSTRN